MEHLKNIANVIKNRLPHAFDYKYWSMANTTYKEEIANSIIEEYKLSKENAKRFLRMCGLFKKDFPILYYTIDGHIAESMGAHYGVTETGKKFIDKYILE